jgi:hypothetical protein
MMNESWPIVHDVMTGGLSGNWRTPVDNVSSLKGRAMRDPWNIEVQPSLRSAKSAGMAAVPRVRA